MSSEEQSIKARDIFGVKVAEAEEAGRFLGTRGDDYDDAEHNPFVVFLRKALAKVIDTTEGMDSVRWTPGLWPSYEICADEASALVGGDEKATCAILCGAAALHEMPKASPADRAVWARAEFDRKYGDLDDLLGELSPSAGGKDGGNIPASSDDGVAS